MDWSHFKTALSIIGKIPHTSNAMPIWGLPICSSEVHIFLGWWNKFLPIKRPIRYRRSKSRAHAITIGITRCGTFRITLLRICKPHSLWQENKCHEQEGPGAAPHCHKKGTAKTHITKVRSSVIHWHWMRYSFKNLALAFEPGIWIPPHLSHPNLVMKIEEYSPPTLHAPSTTD